MSVDYKAEADKVNDYFANRELTDAEVIALGQMNATLALAEQKRIANLIVVATRNDDALNAGYARAKHGSPVDFVAERAKVDGWFQQIREALGLS